ncbi:HupE/UreJ family protein [Microbulbifer harenosus]|nr:HupE/UreJ family protein [Microbulbifer harenosus]
MTLHWIKNRSIRIALVGTLLFGISFLTQAHELRPPLLSPFQSTVPNFDVPSTDSIYSRDEIAQWPVSGKNAGMYFALGFTHMLLGMDHLLFVLALVVLVSGWRQLITTITAFTLAHSVTLSLAVLGIAGLPQEPVEVVIALSVAFVAVEILHKLEGRKTLTIRKPWLVAFGFGLLHGFGFAGALSDIGLPDHAIPLSLAVFNLGIEVGQLAFILAIGALGLVLRRMPSVHQWEVRTGHSATVASALPVAYLVGGLSVWWLMGRTIALVI